MNPRFLALFMTALSLSAHDFWIRPSSHRAEPGEVVKVHLKVGERMKGESLRRNPERMEALVAAGPGGEAPVPGVEGMDPAGFFKAGPPGTYVLAYRGRPSRVELEPSKFEAYLREEGLESVSERRAAWGDSGKPGRERFIRCAKALVRVGAAPGGYDRRLGLRLELVPEADPLVLAPGASLPVQVLYEGRPLAHTLVVARSEARPLEPVKARTDAEGRASLPLDASGRWMVKTVHMEPLEGAADADWESLWASLSFDLR